MNMFLKKRLAAKKNKKKGFTLIEVIVVIVIIAILAAIAVPSLTRYIGSAGLRADMATGHNLQVVIQAELSDLYLNGIDWGTTTANGTQNTKLDSKKIATGATPNTINDVLLDNGVVIDWGTGGAFPTLTNVEINPTSGRLVGFRFETDKSIVTYGSANPTGAGTGLHQVAKP